jgi:phosphohistidine phosphatase
MDIYVIRHGIAEPRGTREDDDARRLTARGRRRLAGVVRGLRRLGVRLDRLYHSPLTRAVESADLALRLVDGESVVEPRLAEPPTPALMTAFEGERVGVVGHEPYLGELVQLLTGGAVALELEKGGVVWLEGEPGEMSLRALYPPRVLRRISRGE